MLHRSRSVLAVEEVSIELLNVSGFDVTANETPDRSVGLRAANYWAVHGVPCVSAAML
jgi:hypothetical protein